MMQCGYRKMRKKERRRSGKATEKSNINSRNEKKEGRTRHFNHNRYRGVEERC